MQVAWACRTRALLHILPLYVTSPKGLGKGTGKAGGAPRGPVITIQGCRLPESQAPKISSDTQAEVRFASVGLCRSSAACERPRFVHS